MLLYIIITPGYDEGSLSFDDILGQTYAIYIISIAGAESAIGLGIINY